jgi:ABC-type branched-subunit amino acid transport system ATPase component
LDNNKKKILELKNVSAGYDGNNIINDISFYVKELDIVAVLGANGSGKSTLLKAIMKLLKKVEGEILVYGNSITRFNSEKIYNLGINMLLQTRNTFSELTVLENVELINGNIKKSEIINMYEYFNNISDGLFTGLLEEKFKNKRVGLLSGGERQKLALLMSLINSPKLILMDEPTASLSVEMVNKVMKLIKKLNQDINITFIIVEQNIRSVLSVVNKVFIMKNGCLSSIENIENILLEEKLEEIFLK